MGDQVTNIRRKLYRGANVSDPALVRQWKESVNGRIADQALIDKPQPAALPTAQRRLDAPSYYAGDTQILTHGDSAVLLFTRPRPAFMPDRNIAPTPLREPITMIGMNVQALADLSNTIDAAIQQIEEQGRQAKTNSVEEQDANHPAEPVKDGEDANSPTLPSRWPRIDGLLRLGRHPTLIAIASIIRSGAFKTAALLGAFVLILALWYWDASLLTAAADENLRLLEAATKLLPLDWASKVEIALRMFGADRALLLIEAAVAVKLMMLSAAFPFRVFRRRGAGLRRLKWHEQVRQA
jgi:hypothetical protein